MKPRMKRQKAKRSARTDIVITVSYRRVKGLVRQVYHVRLAPLQTDRFRFGLPLGETLSRRRAERHADHVAEYVDDWLAALRKEWR